MSKGSVLIVEDDMINSMVLKSFVTNIGYEVVDICMCGEDAIKSVKVYNPDLILMDYNLLGSYDGAETAKKIETISDAHFIFVTGEMKSDVIKEVIEIRGFKGILSKPFDNLLLTSMINKSMEGKK